MNKAICLRVFQVCFESLNSLKKTLTFDERDANENLPKKWLRALVTQVV